MRSRLSVRRRIFELVLFAMLGAVMFCSKLITEALPNIHLLGMFTMLYTLLFRAKALIPIYVFVFLTGLYAGFSPWWIPYLYLWLILWAVTMLLPRKLPKRGARILYPAVCSLFGLAYGTLYAPAQALMYHIGWEGMLAWIAAGFSFDLLHAAGNLFAGLLIHPLSVRMKKLLDRTQPS
ncbi:MAG: hypothetical protein IJY42_06465 [Clostridia bacterium]|nr:hypothetical protein [Clostridia bacterium]